MSTDDEGKVGRADELPPLILRREALASDQEQVEERKPSQDLSSSLSEVQKMLHRDAAAEKALLHTRLKQRGAEPGAATAGAAAAGGGSGSGGGAGDGQQPRSPFGDLEPSRPAGDRVSRSFGPSGRPTIDELVRRRRRRRKILLGSSAGLGGTVLLVLLIWCAVLLWPEGSPEPEPEGAQAAAKRDGRTAADAGAGPEAATPAVAAASGPSAAGGAASGAAGSTGGEPRPAASADDGPRKKRSRVRSSRRRKRRRAVAKQRRARKRARKAKASSPKTINEIDDLLKGL